MFDYNLCGHERTIVIAPHAYDEGIPKFPLPSIRIFYPRREIDFNRWGNKTAEFYEQWKDRKIMFIHSMRGEGVDIGFPHADGDFYVTDTMRKIIPYKTTIGRFPGKGKRNPTRRLNAIQLEVNNDIIRSHEFEEVLKKLYRFFNEIRM